VGPPLEPSPLWPHVRLADTDRLESFSDGVFAITITLSVFEIVRPEHEPGHLLEKLLAQWPNYVAFLASFFYIGVIWLNHRAVFARVHYCDRSLHLANLFSLLASALIPFPTAVLSTALQHQSWSLVFWPVYHRRAIKEGEAINVGPLLVPELVRKP